MNFRSLKFRHLFHRFCLNVLFQRLLYRSFCFEVFVSIFLKLLELPLPNGESGVAAELEIGSRRDTLSSGCASEVLMRKKSTFKTKYKVQHLSITKTS